MRDADPQLSAMLRHVLPRMLRWYTLWVLDRDHVGMVLEEDLHAFLHS